MKFCETLWNFATKISMKLHVISKWLKIRFPTGMAFSTLYMCATHTYAHSPSGSRRSPTKQLRSGWSVAWGGGGSLFSEAKKVFRFRWNFAHIVQSKSTCLYFGFGDVTSLNGKNQSYILKFGNFRFQFHKGTVKTAEIRQKRGKICGSSHLNCLIS